eukprot:CAMPEP_0117419262 /NCGR_PEP_ID=MMETSP0758-20121206/864_1 /TAXON_ID=63605 /ORGANISM="Percolomonas cosmopolitus, Strain AE-1 (ATCC 50343)" /LENGTH=175 /DNA_ID=CAMNT_0005200231 /DNA_START=1244 /DNA_END=1771 /DNA_ORIENTATION=-
MVVKYDVNKDVIHYIAKTNHFVGFGVINSIDEFKPVYQISENIDSIQLIRGSIAHLAVFDKYLIPFTVHEGGSKLFEITYLDSTPSGSFKTEGDQTEFYIVTPDKSNEILKMTIYGGMIPIGVSFNSKFMHQGIIQDTKLGELNSYGKQMSLYIDPNSPTISSTPSTYALGFCKH